MLTKYVYGRVSCGPKVSGLFRRVRSVTQAPLCAVFRSSMHQLSVLVLFSNHWNCASWTHDIGVGPMEFHKIEHKQNVAANSLLLLNIKYEIFTQRVNVLKI